MGAGKEPTPNFDAHVSQFAPNPSEPVHVIINKSQVHECVYFLNSFKKTNILFVCFWIACIGIKHRLA